MKTHYSGHPQDDEEQAACGTWIGKASNLTGDWSRVDCRRCTMMFGHIPADEVCDWAPSRFTPKPVSVEVQP